MITNRELNLLYGKRLKSVEVDEEFYHKKMRFILEDGSVFVVELSEDEFEDESYPFLWHYFEDIT